MMDNSSRSIKVKCILTVVMVDTGKTAFIAGRVYNALDFARGTITAINEQGESSHVIATAGHGSLDDWFKDHFVLVEDEDDDPNTAYERAMKGM